jgi:DNA-binding protein HU-beta
MNKQDLIKKVSTLTGYSEEIVKNIINETIDSIKDNLYFGIDVHIMGFLSLVLVKKKASILRNPKTGEKVMKPKRYDVKITLSRIFRKKIESKTVY